MRTYRAVKPSAGKPVTAECLSRFTENAVHRDAADTAAELLLFFAKRAFPELTRKQIEARLAEEIGVSLPKATSWLRFKSANRLPSDQERMKIYALLKRQLESLNVFGFIVCLDEQLLERAYGPEAWQGIMADHNANLAHLSSLDAIERDENYNPTAKKLLLVERPSLTEKIARGRSLYVELLMIRWQDAAAETLLAPAYTTDMEAITWPAIAHYIEYLEPRLSRSKDVRPWNRICVGVDAGGCGGMWLVNFQKLQTDKHPANEPFLIVRYKGRICLGRQFAHNPKLGDKRPISLSAGEHVWAGPAPSICQWDPTPIDEALRFQATQVELHEVQVVYVSTESEADIMRLQASEIARLTEEVESLHGVLNKHDIVKGVDGWGKRRLAGR